LRLFTLHCDLAPEQRVVK